MKKITVSHVFVLSHSRHVLPYVDFIRTDLSHSYLQQRVLIYSKEEHSIFEQLKGIPIDICKNRNQVVNTIKLASATHKVILHGLYDNVILFHFLFNKKVLKHVIWSMWGADLYYQSPPNFKGKLITLARHLVLPQIGTKIGLTGDFEYLKQWAKVNCNQFYEIGFPAWFYNVDIKQEMTETLTEKTSGLSAIVGNSGDTTNNYDQLIELLSTTSLFSKLTFILNYGAEEAEIARIKTKAEKKLTKIQLVFLTEACSYHDFVTLVARHDALIYNHDRQQGVGTLNIACEYGLDIFVPKLNPLYRTYKKWQITIHDTHELTNFKATQLMSAKQKAVNKYSIRNIFHPQSCAKNIQDLLLGTKG